MIPKKYFKYIYALFGALILAFIIKESRDNGDFKVFLEAAKMIIHEGESPYNKWIHVGGENYCFYFYSPFWAVLLGPFSNIPNYIPNFLWLLANVYFIYRIWQLLLQYLEGLEFSKQQINLILFLGLLLSYRFILLNFNMIQMTIFLLWGALEGLQQIKKGRFVIGSVLLALIINVKILPIVLVPYLLYRSYYKAVASIAVFSGLFLLLPALVVGWSENVYLHTEWWKVLTESNTQFTIETEFGPHSLTALIPTLLSATEGPLPYTRNIASLSPETSIMVLRIVQGFLVVFTLFFLKWPPFTTPKSRVHHLRELAYLLLLIPLIFPHQQKYAFAFAIPAVFYICTFLVSHYKSSNRLMSKSKWTVVIVLTALSFLLMIASTDDLIGKTLNKITQHYKTITWGALLLIVNLCLISPRYFQKRAK